MLDRIIAALDSSAALGMTGGGRGEWRGGVRWRYGAWLGMEVLDSSAALGMTGNIGTTGKARVLRGGAGVTGWPEGSRRDAGFLFFLGDR